MRAGWLAAVLLVCGCDELFGIDPIRVPLPDAAIVAACTLDEHCFADGVQGDCECGSCSYKDLQCPATNRRWAVGAKLGLSDTCVPALDQVDSHVFHTCARMTDGTAWCWGWNTEGQLGAGQPLLIDSNLPVHVASSSGIVTNIVQVAAGGSHSCALVEGGTVSCWGSNRLGQLGAGLPAIDGARSLDPVQVMTASGPLVDVTQIATGFFHVCALVGPPTGPEVIYCWGDNPHFQLGTSAVGTSNIAIPVTNLPAGDILGLSVGGDDTCAIVDAAGTDPPRAYCWGRQDDGRLGNGQVSANDIETPARVGWMNDGNGLPDVQSVRAGPSHTCAIKRPNGELYCWGKDNDNKLGNDTAVASVGLASRTNWPDGDYGLIGLGDRHSCATFAAETLCWGYDGDGRVGDGPASSATQATPVPVISGSPLRDLAVGFEHTCALGADRSLRCWGANMRGQLGVGDTANRDAPTDVASAAFCPVAP